VARCKHAIPSLWIRADWLWSQPPLREVRAASQGRHSTRLTELQLASQFVLAGETTNRHLYAAPFGDAAGRTTNDCDQDDAMAQCICFPADDGGFLEHPAGNNILFGDLHVDAFQEFDPNLMTYHPHQMLPWADVTPPK
jgi:prepilin-type processing-associated H-X9-DG protein